MKKTDRHNNSKLPKPRRKKAVSFDIGLTVIQSDEKSAHNFGQQLALIVNELLKSGELK